MLNTSTECFLLGKSINRQLIPPSTSYHFYRSVPRTLRCDSLIWMWWQCG